MIIRPRRLVSGDSTGLGVVTLTLSGNPVPRPSFGRVKQSTIVGESPEKKGQTLVMFLRCNH